MDISRIAEMVIERDRGRKGREKQGIGQGRDQRRLERKNGRGDERCQTLYWRTWLIAMSYCYEGDEIETNDMTWSWTLVWKERFYLPAATSVPHSVFQSTFPLPPRTNTCNQSQNACLTRFYFYQPLNMPSFPGRR